MGWRDYVHVRNFFDRVMQTADIALHMIWRVVVELSTESTRSSGKVHSSPHHTIGQLCYIKARQLCFASRDGVCSKFMKLNGSKDDQESLSPRVE